MYDVQQPLPSTRRATPKARVRSRRNAVTSALLAAFMALPVVATGQNGPADQAGGAPPTVTSTSTALDVDRLVADALDRGVLLQRTRTRPTGNSSNNTMKWVGVGMLGLGACWPSTGRSAPVVPASGILVMVSALAPASAGAALPSGAALPLQGYS